MRLDLLLEGLPAVELHRDVVDEHRLVADVGKQRSDDIIKTLCAVETQTNTREWDLTRLRDGHTRNKPTVARTIPKYRELNSDVMNICVFLSAADRDERYTRPAREFAELIGNGGHSLVWGGSDTGLMKVIADDGADALAYLEGLIRGDS